MRTQAFHAYKCDDEEGEENGWMWDERAADEAGLMDELLMKGKDDIGRSDELLMIAEDEIGRSNELVMIAEDDIGRSDDLVMNAEEDVPTFDLCPGEPLIIGDSEHGIKVGEAVAYFMQLRIDQGWSRPAFDRFLKVQIMLMGGPARCRLPSTLYKMRTYMKVQDHMAYAVHVCPQWCRHYPHEPDENRWDPTEECGTVLEKDDEGTAVRHCKETRFEWVESAKGKQLRPREWFYYVPVRETIRRWMECPQFCRARARRDARSQRDFWTSDLAKSINRHEAVNGALLQTAPSIPTPEGGEPDVEYAEHHVMVISVGADDCQLFDSDVG